MEKVMRRSFGANCGVVRELHWTSLAGAVGICILLGCEAQKPSGSPSRAGDASPSRAAVATSDLKLEAGVVGRPVENRKIIYRAKIELAVEDFGPVPASVAELVKKFDGYVADSTLGGTPGVARRGTWKVRVPVARFDEFVTSAKGLGELVNASTQSEDVSDEYFDIEARIRNKTKEEERLLKLLEERTGKLADVIEVERELSRVREETERMQGRIRVMADLTAFTTVDINVNEIRGYVPPAAPDLSTRIRRTFAESVNELRMFGEELLVGFVGFGPWIPVLLICFAPPYLVIRRNWRRWTRSQRGAAA
ncbi:MAG: DUF4349 domain-containing protein [Pirellula sp.]|nr:DUF4349 domain-containing protein [Pirellula sp.]